MIGRREDHACVCGGILDLEHALWTCEQNYVARIKLMESLDLQYLDTRNPPSIADELRSRDSRKIKAILTFLNDIEYSY